MDDNQTSSPFFTDWDVFKESFKRVIYQRSYKKDAYTLFWQMQYALEIYGIVKGKPKKQKFMSLLNDGKHVYNAGHAHVIVTNDSDMIAKAKMTYKIWGIETAVFKPEEFEGFLR